MKLPDIPSSHASWLATPQTRLLRAIAAHDPRRPLADSHAIAELAAQVEVADFLSLVRRHRVTGSAWLLLQQVSKETGITLALSAPLAELATRISRRNLIYHLE